MLSGKLAFSLVVVLALLSPVAFGEVITVTLSGTGTEDGNINLKFRVAAGGLVGAGNEGVTPGESALSVRNGLVSAEGESVTVSGDNVDIVYQRVTVNGLPAFKATSTANFSVLVEDTFVEPGTAGVEARGITFAACVTDTCSAGGSGVVPAVSTWGMVAMTLMVLTAGTLIYARQRGVSSIAG